MKALEILKNLKNEMQDKDGIVNWDCSYKYFKKVKNAIKELEDLQKEYQELKEYYWFARNHIDTFRCECGSLGRVGYLCSNKDCEVTK